MSTSTILATVRSWPPDGKPSDRQVGRHATFGAVPLDLRFECDDTRGTALTPCLLTRHLLPHPTALERGELAGAGAFAGQGVEDARQGFGGGDAFARLPVGDRCVGAAGDVGEPPLLAAETTAQLL